MSDTRAHDVQGMAAGVVLHYSTCWCGRGGELLITPPWYEQHLRTLRRKWRARRV